MDLFGAPAVLFDFLIFKVLPFLVILTLVVFFHELGHFLVGRWNRVKVLVFAVGFGPELFGFTDRHGTRWKFCAIPLGGYVRFHGDADASSRSDPEAMAKMSAEDREGAFPDAALWRKALIVAAGPIANFLLAWVIYTGLFLNHGETYMAPVIGQISEGSAAEEAGFQIGDRVIAVEGSTVKSFSEISNYTHVSSDRSLQFIVERDGQELPITAAPKMTQRTDRFGNVFYTGLVGIGPKNDPELIIRRDLGVLEATSKGAGAVWQIISRTYYFIKELIVGKQDASELRGPLGIGHMTSQVATLGIAELISLMAALSVSIGIMNLLPVPVLDGGHLLMYAIHAVRGREMSQNAQEWAFKVGLTCVLMLMLYATSNDIRRLFGMLGV
ncbi:MAG: RIP metalloprotease RseP [Ahrensia sp.]|nr:RIP metalloprotease RseP [Ahrensia sp.]